MSASDSDPSDYPDLNPFSPIAVARVAEFDEDESVVTIETEAIRQAVGAVRDFVVAASAVEGKPNARETRSAEGRVLAIVGDYGTGKTHLAMRLLRYVRENPQDGVRGMYLDAAADGFLAVYRRFIAKLTLDELKERVKAYYSQIVVDSLVGTDVPDDIVQRLRTSDFDPVVVVDRLALMEAGLLRELKDRLLGVTKNEQYGTALMLLLRSGFEESVWAWLQGARPDVILTERGITTWIGDDVPALEAMGVIALLYGGTNHKFMLVIDELDKVLSATASPRAATLHAFRELLRVFSAAGAMLVLAGLPDFLQIIGADVTARIGQVVEMTPLTSAQAQRFIEDSNEQTLGVRRLWPFGEDAVDYLVRITNGTARQIIRLCYHAFRLAVDERGQVTVDMLERLARDQFYLPSHDEVRNVVKQVLDRYGRSYLRDQLVGANSESRVDFWITVADAGVGCGIIVAESVLTDDNVAILRRRATAITQVSSDNELLLVVNGYIPTGHSDELAGVFGTEPIIYHPVTFADTLSAALSAVTQRMERLVSDDPGAAVRERVERINRLQVNAQSVLEHLGDQIEDLRATSSKRLDKIQDQVRSLARDVASGGRTTDPAPSVDDTSTELAVELPAEVDRIFTEALDGLADLDQFDDLLGTAFGNDEGLSPDRAMSSQIRGRLRSHDSSQAAGVAVLLQKSIRAFRRGIELWYYRHDRLHEIDQDRLDELCNTYDTVVEHLPAVQLPEVTKLISNEAETTPTQQASQQRSQFRTRETLEHLSLHVRSAVLRSVSASR
jgi:Cdc6-like AAA superfamily ATPase